MRFSHRLTHSLLILSALIVLSAAALAADPGLPIPADAQVSDQKAGSVLVYNVYSSSLNNPGAENTRINVTNTSDQSSAFVHLFFIDGTSCSVADSFICLTKNQTMTFSMSDIDPGVMGYIIAVATNSGGCPINFNHLIGDEYVKFQSGHQANLGAEAFSALFGIEGDAVGDCGEGQSTAEISFDGEQYNRAPRVLAVDNLASQADGNSTLLILNRIGGADLSSSAASIGSLFGILFDQLENPYSFTFKGGCQVKATFNSATFPRTTPRLNSVIPAGSSGWMKFWGTSEEVGLLGAVINLNLSASTNSNAFNGGHNLHKLTLVGDLPNGETTRPLRIVGDELFIPIFPANCR